MSGNHSNQNNLEDRYQKLNKITDISKKLQRDDISLPANESRILLDFEEAVLECMNYGWEIDSMLEDENLSPYEYDQLVSRLEKLSEVIDILLEKHKSNVETLNKVISIYKILKSLIKEIQFVEDIVIILTKTYTVEKKTAYTINESEYLVALEALDSFFKKSKIKADERKESKLERELLELAKIIGKLEEKHAFNSLYTSPTILMNEIISSLEILEAMIEPFYHMVKGNYYSEEISSAKIGLVLLSQNKELDVGETIKIRGLFSRKRGIEELEELSDVLRSLEKD
ncbi:MAG: hypothetical protein ACW96U_09295 [Candidatus Heimdallarchaeaceae archaeon]|jgi:hypothetical protein